MLWVQICCHKQCLSHPVTRALYKARIHIKAMWGCEQSLGADYSGRLLRPLVTNITQITAVSGNNCLKDDMFSAKPKATIPSKSEFIADSTNCPTLKVEDYCTGNYIIPKENYQQAASLFIPSPRNCEIHKQNTSYANSAFTWFPAVKLA